MLPLAWLNGAVLRLRRAAYRLGLRQAWVAPVPLVVVGNIYVGGTGKTPLLIALIQELRARGWHPGVVSRGYGAQVGEQPNVGCGELDPRAFGDEPALISARTHVPIAVHPRRPAAVRSLLAAHPEVDVVLSDDGLQHLALARDVEIVVQDARGVGNGRLLPAGPLRESAARLASVDALVTNLNTGDAPGPARTIAARQLDMRVAGDVAVNLRSGEKRSLASFANAGKVGAAAGIGRPSRFFSMLHAVGIQPVEELALPDHYDYAVSPFSAINADAVLITEKDAVKCGHLDDPRLWSVAVSAHLSDPYFFDWLEARLHGRTFA
ncbi:tetraacyldisaccharide 4'-kinase [Pigmentiphaga aceris]|uniref:Tetraacyldisaccharide 4'-kinase n=1 Tax=Pigmentiphaga aceris TaxID=1940612 RepID=A0A5C0B6H7_9BURK|nr:tetraacyldisaccharide 4'-kinase [Pigmentiphaga aceris]QEI09373.1 tetraacyldisaccharide 4'-kinase [Pigmentiphaga aceris]